MTPAGFELLDGLRSSRRRAASDLTSDLSPRARRRSATS